MLRMIQIGLFLLGLAISLYLLFGYSVYNDMMICPTDGCNEVAMSKYSKIGKIPISFIGVMGYLLLINFSVYKWKRMLNVALIVGFLFSLYLISVSTFIINQVCFWCLLSFFIIILTCVLQLKVASKDMYKK